MLLEAELLAQNAFIEIVARIKQHVDRYAVVHADVDAANRSHLVMIGDGGDRSLIGIHHFDRDFRAIRQQCAAPPSRPERADGRECE